MVLNKNIIYMCRDEEKDFNMLKNKKKINIVLLKEDIFIKIIKINKKENISKILNENIESTFRYYEVLIHNEVIKVNGEKYLIIYFISYYNNLKNLISKTKNIEIKPYEFTSNFKNNKKDLSIIIRSFKETIYLVGMINKKIVYTKNFNDYEDINKSIYQCLDSLKEIFCIDKNFNISIDETIYNEKLKDITESIKIIKGKVS